MVRHDSYVDTSSDIIYEFIVRDQLTKRVFKFMNIGFLRPSQDECDYCAVRKKGEENHNANECTLCDEMKLHLERAETARKMYEEARKDISENCSE